MLSCECGFVYHQTEAEKALTSMQCPKCKRKITKGETWIMPVGNMNMFEAKKNDGREMEYLKQRKMKHGF